MKCKAKVMVSPSDVPQLVKPCSLASSLVAPLPSLVYNMPLPLTLKGSYLSIPVNSSLVSLGLKISPQLLYHVRVIQQVTAFQRLWYFCWHFRRGIIFIYESISCSERIWKQSVDFM